MAPPGPVEHRNSFDALRVAAALCVFLGHQCDLMGFKEPVLGPLGITLSNTGLFVFFAVSGYLVAQSLARDPRPLAFLRARASRIYPGAAVNAVACVLLGAAVTTLPAAHYWTEPGTWRYLAHGIAILVPPTVLELPGVFADAPWPSVDTPIWTLKYELLCYGVLLLLGLGARAARLPWRGTLGLAAALLVVAYVWRIAAAPPPPEGEFYTRFNGFNLLRFGMIFAAGALYAEAASLRLALALGAAALVVLAPAAEVARAGLLLLVVPLAIEVGRSPILFSPRYRRFGDLSYGLYLYGYPVQVLLATRFAGRLGFWPLALVALGATLVCATLSWLLVERPALRWKRGTAPRPARL